MIKWPWKSNELKIDKSEVWQQALDIPLFSDFNNHEQQRLIRVATHLLQHKRLMQLQGLALDETMQARIALLFALPVMEPRRRVARRFP